MDTQGGPVSETTECALHFKVYGGILWLIVGKQIIKSKTRAKKTTAGDSRLSDP